MSKHTKSARLRIRDPFKNLFTPQERLKMGMSVPEQFAASGGSVPGTLDKMHRRLSLKPFRHRSRVIRRLKPKRKEQGI